MKSEKLLTPTMSLSANDVSTGTLFIPKVLQNPQIVFSTRVCKILAKIIQFEQQYKINT